MLRTTSLALVLLLALGATGCQATAAHEGAPTLTVFAAASLADPFNEISRNFEAVNPGVKVVLNFGGSQSLRTQIEHGARADVFASADTANMDPLVGQGLLASAPVVFARNELTVVLPKGNPARVATLRDLARSGVKVIVADSAVPVGNYTVQVLDNLSRDPELGEDWKSRVLANVASRENDVKAVVSKVSLGEGDAGFVYVTDARAAGDRLVTLAIPPAYNVRAEYPIAVSKSTTGDAGPPVQFLHYVLSSQGQSILAKYGFSPR